MGLGVRVGPPPTVRVKVRVRVRVRVRDRVGPASDGGGVRARRARGVDMVVAEHERVREELDDLLVEQAAVARAQDDDVLVRVRVGVRVRVRVGVRVRVRVRQAKPKPKPKPKPNLGRVLLDALPISPYISLYLPYLPISP